MKAKKRYISILAFAVSLIGAFCILSYHYKLLALNISLNRSHEEKSFTIMTFNVDAKDTLRFTDAFQDKLIKTIRQEQPDILCFQELPFENLKKIKPQLDSLYGATEELKSTDQVWRFTLYSRYPMRNFQRYSCTGDVDTYGMSAQEIQEVKLYRKHMNLVSAEFEVEPGNWVTVFSGHLRSSAYSTARRSMDKDASWFDGVSLYKRNYDVGKRIRDYEAENVRRFADEARSKGMPVIIAGDLNDWCGSDCLNTLMGNDLKDAWWEGGNGFGWTYFGWHLRLRLDHILYSDELELEDVKVVDTDLSDHKPLMASFRVK